MDSNGDTFDGHIHVVNDRTSPWKTIEQVANMENQEHPFYVCDIDNIIQKYESWVDIIPRVKPHYAVKCNDHPIVLKLMAAMGLGFDCATKMEINKVLTLGVDPSRIIYAHTTKPPSHIQYAAEVNVDLMTFDNELEVSKIKNIFPNARTVIRIRYDDAKASVCLGLKFGCEPYTEASRLLQIAKNLDINVVGVSFHVGWDCRDPSAYYRAIKSARYVFDVASNVGYNLRLLDIGGGFPGDSNSSIKEYGKAINDGLEEFFSDQAIRVISEPGTYFVDSAFKLACNVCSIREVTEDNSSGDSAVTQYEYYLNDGVLGSLSIVISANARKVPVLLKARSGTTEYPSTIWGPTPRSIDRIISDILLPRLQLGDWLVFTDMGAYTLTITTPFCSFELPKVYSIISRSNWLFLHKNLPFTEKDFVVNKTKELGGSTT